MNTFDPNQLRKAVENFSPRQPRKFQDLASAKDMIAELRQKGGSFETIAELLTQHGLPTSRSSIAGFCHEVLGERLRSKRRAATRRSPTQNSDPSLALNQSSVLPLLAHEHDPSTPVATPDTTEPTAPRSKGPRIANIRLAQPTEA